MKSYTALSVTETVLKQMNGTEDYLMAGGRVGADPTKLVD
jgi:hypothetical protein